MLGNTIGILLSRREWNKLNRANFDLETSFYHYAKKGEELNLEVVFIPINNISITEGKAEAIVIKNNTIIHKGMVNIPSIIYNPTKFNRKTNIKMIRELSQHPNVHLINEHHVLKDKYVFDIIQSQPELQKYVNNEIYQTDSSITFYLLGQKNMKQQWEVFIIFAKDLDEKKYSYEDAYQLINNNHTEKENKNVLLNEISQNILSIIQYYYPGLNEIGLQFILNQDGEVTLKSFCTKKSIEKDLFGWNQQLWKKIVEWPIELAYEIKLKNEYLKEINNQNEHENDKFQPSLYLEGTDYHVWVKFEPFQDDEMIIKVPKGILKHKLNQLYDIQFGVKKETCVYFISKETAYLRNNCYEYPLVIFVSSSLVERMRIPLNLVYQLKISNEKIMIGPTIGFLLGEKNQLYNPEYMKKFSDRFGKYEKFGGLAIAFSTRSIDWNEKIVYGMIYDPKQKKWIYNSAPIPSTLYRRNFHQNKKTIKQLRDITENQLFNSHHFKKSDLYNLREDLEISDHLPETHILDDMDKLIEFINLKQKVILKPVSLSRGRGIFIIEKNKEELEGFILYDYRKKYRVRHLLSDSIAFHDMLESLGIFKQNYLFQTYIPLLNVNERPFDVRVVMQKYKKNKWVCSGIECRIAGENEDLTNIARGGKAMTLEEVIQDSGKNLSYSKIKNKMLLICHDFCDLMDKKEEHYAEFGLDIALDEQGYPWLLEANIFPSFKGFKDIDFDMYLKIRYQPLFYAVKLQGFDVLEEESVFDEVYNQNQ
ncbi:YheC/YheD family protein [Lederbergia citrea]|uniref:YheC/YheD family endospore coat-associated protein n=1 Tax=Lederbergia citrea TaxID=2833581 RepID=UPI001BC99263|nr:YheC/YheD family protein [Lederbergia citrea]MBS4203237.1 YheC/YheD family protein [Lederbergia citrea]